MAKPNYAFEKRQRDLAKKQKKEEKLKRKTETTGDELQEPEDTLATTDNADEPAQGPGEDVEETKG